MLSCKYNKNKFHFRVLGLFLNDDDDDDDDDDDPNHNNNKSIQFNLCLFTCKLKSTEASYKFSTST
jgi:hypothetical protein